VDIESQRAECEPKAQELLSSYFDNGVIRSKSLHEFSEKCQALMSAYPEYAALQAAAGNYSFNKTNFDHPLTITNPSISKLKSFFTPNDKAKFTNYKDLQDAYIISLQQKIDKKLSQAVSLYAFHMIFLGKININGSDMRGIADVAAYIAFKYKQELLLELTKERW